MLKTGVDVVKLVRLGRLSYNPALKIQKWFQEQHLQHSDSQQILIIVEHDPVYTLGLREKLEPDRVAALTGTGAQIVKSDRGGLTTFHGPGQLVAYPILHLNRLRPRLTLRKYVALLEEVGVHTCRMLGVPAEVSNLDVSHTGAWVRDKKICAIGVHCKRHVTTHGLALNCDVDLGWYEHITPCGIKDKGITSISDQLQENVSVNSVESQFLASFQSTFKCGLQDYDGLSLARLLEKYKNCNTVHENFTTSLLNSNIL